MNRIENKTSGEYTSEIQSLNLIKRLSNYNIEIQSGLVVMLGGSMFDISGSVVAEDINYTIGSYSEGKYITATTLAYAIEDATPLYDEIKQGYYDGSKRVLAYLLNNEVILLDKFNYINGMGTEMYDDSLFSYVKNSYEKPYPLSTGVNSTYANFTQVIWTGEKYVGVGRKYLSAQTGNANEFQYSIGYSTDLQNWTFPTLANNYSGGNFKAVAHNGSGTLIAVGAATTTNWRAYRSTNHGMSWSDITSLVGTPTGAVQNVCYANDRWFINNTSQGYSSYSTNDGDSWATTFITGDSIKRVYGDIVYFNSLWIAPCQNGIFTSSNGTTWTSRFTTVSTGVVQQMKILNGNLVGMGSTTAARAIYTSANGTAWTETVSTNAPVDFYTFSPGSNYWADAVYKDGVYYFISKYNYTAATSNLTNNTWTRLWTGAFPTKGVDFNFFKIEDCNGTLVIGGESTDSRLDAYKEAFHTVPVWNKGDF